MHADYDDGFVAYLNGVEIARNNIGTPGTPPAYSSLANAYKEATLYSGGKPEDYPLRSSDLAEKYIQARDEYTLAIQIHNQSAELV